ncbi:hypothetical protein O6H91_03G079800 [Diphasiastrum complanatum]|nr:hypothetical protein O6H91_03G079800 [Diphasiastrum complanatum]
MEMRSVLTMRMKTRFRLGGGFSRLKASSYHLTQLLSFPVAGGVSDPRAMASMISSPPPLNPQHDIHAVAAKGFDVDAHTYESNRPSYPAAAVSDLCIHLHLNPERSHVLDLASGSGKFTRLLLPHCLKLTAVEPSPSMRSAFANILPNIQVLDGSASAIPLASASQDAVVIAQAFHWFANLRSLREIHRVLKPGGRLGLIWNLEDRHAKKWVASLRDLYERYEMGTPQYRLGLWRGVWGTAEARELFTELEKGGRFEHEMVCTEEMVYGRVVSKSYIACWPAEEKESLRERVLQALRSAEDVERDAGGLIRYPYKTEVFWCEKRSG